MNNLFFQLYYKVSVHCILSRLALNFHSGSHETREFLKKLPTSIGIACFNCKISVKFQFYSFPWWHNMWYPTHELWILYYISRLNWPIHWSRMKLWLFFFFFWSVWQNWQKNLKRKIDLFNSNLFGEKNKKAGFKLSQVGRTQQFSHVLDYKGYHFLKPTTSHIIFYFLEFGFRDRKAKVVDSTQYFWVHLILKLFLLSVWLILLRLLEWASITVHSCLQLCTWVLSG